MHQKLGCYDGGRKEAGSGIEQPEPGLLPNVRDVAEIPGN
jgi:hypothetical protein